MALRRTQGIVSDLESSDAATEADVIVTAAALGFAASHIRNDQPVQFDRDPLDDDPGKIEAFERAVAKIDRAIASHLDRRGEAPTNKVHAGTAPGYTKGAVIVGIYRVAGQHPSPAVNEPSLSAKGRALWEKIRTVSPDTPQYTGRGAYTGFVDNHNIEGDTDPVGPRSTARFTVREPDGLDSDPHPRWLPPLESSLWKSRQRKDTGTYLPWGLIGGDLAQKGTSDSGQSGNLADQVTSEMRDKYGMVFNGEISTDEVASYTHGMIQAIYKAYGLGPSCTPYEIAVGDHTKKLASCLFCTLFMSATGYPPTSVHLGRGESWAPLYGPYNPNGKADPNEAAVIRDLNNSWYSRCHEFLTEGLEILADGQASEDHRTARDAVLSYLKANEDDPTVAAVLILDAATVHDSDTARIDRTLRETSPVTAPPVSVIPHLHDLKVLEEKFPKTAADDESLIHLSERQAVTPGQFNTLDSPVTREIELTGQSLRWDGSNRLLESLRMTRDVTRIVIIADQILIKKPIYWKGAAVEIYARKLTFRGQGMISTTPEAYATEARSEDRDADDRPLTETGEVRGKDGREGEPGGSISLHVAEFDGGPPNKSKRLVTNGAPGEKGERGGLKALAAQKGRPTKKDLDEVTVDHVDGIFRDKGFSTADLDEPAHWFISDGVGEAGLRGFWKRLQALDQYKDHVVTDVRLGLLYQKFAKRVYTETQLPARERKELDLTWDEFEGYEKAWKNTSAFTDLWTPPDGEDAYEPGTSGRGGAGGQIEAPVTIAQALEGHISNAGGDSTPTEYVSGGEPGTPRKYIVVALTAVQTTITHEKLRPRAVHKGGVTRAGNGAKGTTAGPGPKGGDIVTVADPWSWLDPRLTRAVASYARSVFAAGHREEAWEILRPYWEAIVAVNGATASVEWRSSRRAIESLVQNYKQNLDIYGNPPGWVPRFSADSYLKTYLSDRRFSYRFVGVMEKAVALMDSVDQAEAMLGLLANQTEGVIDQIRRDLYALYGQYHAARATMDKAGRVLAEAQRQMDSLLHEAETRAIIQEEDKAVATAIFDVASAVLEAIPVYQPALSGVAKIVEGVGDVVITSVYDSDTATDGWKVLETISSSVADVLGENADTFKDQFSSEMKEKYKDQLNPDETDLRNQVDTLRTALGQQQDEYDEEVVNAHTGLMRNDDLASLLSTDEEITEQLLAQATNREDLKVRLDEHNRLIDDLQEKIREGSGGDLARLRKQQLQVARAKLYTLLADSQNEIRDLKKAQEANEEQREAAETRRADLEQKNTDLEELLPKFNKLKAEKAIEKNEKTFGKVLDGVERLAAGAAKVGGAISSAIGGKDPDSEEVVALKQRILEGPLKEDYERIQQGVETATADMSQAIQDLMYCNQSIATLTGDFSATLQSSIDIGRNRQAFALGIDAGLKSSLLSMQRQARDRMDYYLYLFRKAYMYEFGAPAGAEIAGLNKLVGELDKFLAQSRKAVTQTANGSADEQKLQLMTLLVDIDDDDLAQVGDDTLRNTLSQLGRTILESRQRTGAQSRNMMKSWLPTAHLRSLSDTGRIEIHEAVSLFPDLYEGPNPQKSFFFRNPKLKITSVGIEDGDFIFRGSANADRHTMRIEVSFGKELILWNGSHFVSFRLGKGEEPLQIGFQANEFSRDTEGRWIAHFEPDERSGMDEVFKTVMGSEVSYSEIHPSFLASMTVAIVMGHGVIEDVERFALTVGMQAN